MRVETRLRLSYDFGCILAVMTNANRRAVPLILLGGDMLVLLLFVFIGQRDHNIVDAQPLVRLLMTAGEFALPWVIAAWLLGAYPGGGTLTPRRLLARSLTAWLIAVPMGALLRSIVNGSGVIQVPFLLVTLGLGGCFMLGWRLLFALVLKNRTHVAAG